MGRDVTPTVSSGLMLSFLNPEQGRILETGTGIWSLFGLSPISLYSQSTDDFALAADLNGFTHTYDLVTGSRRAV